MNLLQILGVTLGVLVIGSVGFALLIKLVGLVLGPLPIFGGRNPPDRYRCCEEQSFESIARRYTQILQLLCIVEIEKLSSRSTA